MGIVGVVVVLWLGVATYRDLTLQTSEQMWGDFSQRTEIYDAYIEPDAVVLSDWAAYDALYNRRELLTISTNRPEAELTARVQKYAVRYLVLAADGEFQPRAQGQRNLIVKKFAPTFRRWAAQGYLTPVYQHPYPLSIWRFESVPQ